MKSKYYALFEPKASLHGKTMIIESNNKQQAWQILISYYGKAIQSVYTEQEMTGMLGLLTDSNNIVLFGTKCLYIDRDGSTHEYPNYESYAVDVSSMVRWFEKVTPDINKSNPDSNAVSVQMGCHFEEVSEMLLALNLKEEAEYMNRLADKFKNKEIDLSSLSGDKHIELLDSLCDQIVTSIGVAYRLKYKINDALTEVNASNWSKFDIHGNPVFNEQGKVIKSNMYRKPNLKEYVK